MCASATVSSARVHVCYHSRSPCPPRFNISVAACQHVTIYEHQCSRPFLLPCTSNLGTAVMPVPCTNHPVTIEHHRVPLCLNKSVAVFGAGCFASVHSWLRPDFQFGGWAACCTPSARWSVQRQTVRRWPAGCHGGKQAPVQWSKNAGKAVAEPRQAEEEQSRPG
jgi:hypothetical protein